MHSFLFTKHNYGVIIYNVQYYVAIMYNRFTSCFTALRTLLRQCYTVFFACSLPVTGITMNNLLWWGIHRDLYSLYIHKLEHSMYNQDDSTK